MSCKPFNQYLNEYVQKKGINVVINEDISFESAEVISDAVSAYRKHIEQQKMDDYVNTVRSNMDDVGIETVEYTKDFMLNVKRISVMNTELVPNHPDYHDVIKRNENINQSGIRISDSTLNSLCHKYLGKYADLFDVKVSKGIYFNKKENIPFADSMEIEALPSSMVIRWNDFIKELYQNSTIWIS